MLRALFVSAFYVRAFYVSAFYVSAFYVSAFYVSAFYVSAFYVSGLFVGGPLRYPLYSSRDEISLECFSYRVAKNTFSNGLEDFMTSVFELRHKRA